MAEEEANKELKKFLQDINAKQQTQEIALKTNLEKKGHWWNKEPKMKPIKSLGLSTPLKTESATQPLAKLERRIQDVYHSPSMETQQTEMAIQVVEELKTAKFIDISRNGVKITKEHIHTPVKVTLEICSNCGKVIGGDMKK